MILHLLVCVVVCQAPLMWPNSSSDSSSDGSQQMYVETTDQRTRIVREVPLRGTGLQGTKLQDTGTYWLDSNGKSGTVWRQRRQLEQGQ